MLIVKAQPNIQCEHDLLFCIARRELDADKQSTLRLLLSKPTDWRYLIDLAESHGLLPLLHQHLTSVTHVVPPAVTLELQDRALNNSQTVLHLVGELLKLQRSFSKRGLKLATFKGPVLSQMAYGDMALRRAGDIDVLISRDDFHQAREVLNSLGYKMAYSLSGEQLRSHLAFHCEIPFVSEDSRTVVDLHWDLAPASFVLRLTGRDLISRLQPVRLAGVSVQTFDTEDLIVYLSMHGAKHLWRSLESTSSLAELVRQSRDIDWNSLTKRAISTRTTRMLALGLRLAQRCFDAQSPAEVFKTIDADNSMRQLAEEIKANILYWPVSEPESTETARYNLKIMDRKSDALVSMIRAVCTPTLSDFEAITLPPSLHGLYYAVRPIRLSRSYGVRLWHKVSGKKN